MTSCSHCGLPVPPRQVDPSREEQFCCAGCEMVYGLLRECHVEHLYEQTQRERIGKDPRSQVASSYQSFDHEEFQALYTKPLDSGLREIELYVEGLHCAACVWLLEKLPSMLEGVVDARLNYRRAQLRLTWSPEVIQLSTIARFLERLGYPPHPSKDLQQKQQALEDRRMLIRLAIAGACAGNVMLMAFSLYSGWFFGMGAGQKQLFRWASLVVTLPAVLWSARPFFKGAWRALRVGSLHMDLPIALGISAGFGWGLWNTFRGAGEIYFDSVTTLIFFLLIGRWLQERQQRRAAEATTFLYGLSPSSARRIEGDEIKEVPIEALLPGDRVEVRAGDTIPVDGLLRHGHAQLDLSFLTGESRPLEVAPGEPVHAGSINLASRLEIEVQRTGSETRLGQLLRLVEDASERRAPIVQLADKIAGTFVATVLALALLTLAIWAYLDPPHAIEHAVALLIVTCPCALGLATPLAISAAIGKAARRGILIKGGEALEALAYPGYLWLDKTGTLTQGKMTLIEWVGDRSFQTKVRALEAHSAHPIARALLKALPAQDDLEVSAVKQTIGRGLTGQIEGQPLWVGAPEYIEAHAAPLPTWAKEAIERFGQRAYTPIAIATADTVVAVAALGDPLREEAPALLQKLQRRGWKIGILSGDHPDVVAATAAQLSLPTDRCHGGLTPEQKQAFVEKQTGTVVMVGDGINDAAALASATVGISVHGSAEAALSTADIYLSEDGLQPLDTLLQGAQHTLQVIRRNFAFSLCYNLIGATLALTGWITPLWAAVLMPLSSLTVIASSYQNNSFK